MESQEDFLSTIRRELYTPVVGDVLDVFGKYHQFLPQRLRSLLPGKILAGRAMPVKLSDIFGRQQKPFGLLTEALDQLMPDEVYVAAGGSAECAAWGEILTATARSRGAVGAVIDAYHRDTAKVVEQEWPVFSRGAYAQDAAVRSRVDEFRVPIEIGGVLISPGDLIIGDIDGVVVVPQAIEAEVITAALAKARSEHSVRRAIEGGMSSTAAFKEFGVL